MRSTTRLHTRASLVAAGLLAATALALTACSSTSGSTSESSAPAASAPAASPSQTMDPASDLVGPGCAAYAQQVPSGAGSVAGMAQDPVATAASNNPLLTTLVAAVSGKLNAKVNLVDTLNGSQFTVFAPVDDAFKKIDPATIDTLKTDAGADTLSKILTYHVVAGQISPKDIVGTHKTVEGGDVTVSGSGDSLKVNDANVICGGVHTANATVYLIDSVLMPPAN
ncbi:fasciclin domain-containing protein [Microbacterium sp. NPDC089698]|uniref:fasciclin domain-containing protein n=1 Tax=Microbacterium sp. NPDC089698 TaxID=3364200 RepID=UPI00381C464F